MTVRFNMFLVAAVTVLSTACNGGKTQESEASENIAEQVKAEQEFQALPFPDVQLPRMISSQEGALTYMAENYWNNITDKSRDYLCDSVYVSGVDKDVVEQKFADWTLVLDNVSLQTVTKAIGNLYDRALACELNDSSSNVFETFVTLADKYFYDPNSPLRNEEYYLAFVSKYALYEGLSDVEKEKYEREARLCGLNRLGTKAADFRFSDRRGIIRNLYDIEAPYTLLFFSNPGCNACMEIINVLRDDYTISSLINSGVIKVLNIYIDENIQEWMSYMPIYPEEWYNGFDPDFVLRSNDIYCIRAIPSLYLLDKEKNVLLKDVPENVLFNYLLTL